MPSAADNLCPTLITALIARVLGCALFIYARLCHATSRYVVSAGAEQTLRKTWDAGLPTAYVFWHDEFLLLSVNAFCKRIQFPTCTTNDTFGGQVVATFWKCVGAPVIRIGTHESRENRLSKTREALATGKRLVIAADYGKPWYRLRPTAIQLADQTGGAVVAMHVAVQRRLVLGRGQQRMTIPLPFNTFTLHLSEPLHEAGLDVGSSTSTLESALWGLRHGHALVTHTASEPLSNAAAMGQRV
jgi:lysophospholipid acyltransferase (LPLAT)-like uncharacterized protein